MKTTRKTVAEKAGVSPAVVSYVLNNSNYVNEKTRLRVEKVIKELGYHPNLIARSLKTARTHHLAFICNDFNNPFFSQIAADVTKIAFDNNYLLSINDLGYDDTRIQLLLQYKVDGMFISSDLFTSEEINRFADLGIAVVLLTNRNYANLNPSVACIQLGIYEGMTELIHYLIQKGHRKYAFISSARPSINNPDTIVFENYRYLAFQETLDKYKYSGKSFFIDSVVEYTQISSIVDKILNGNQATAIVAGNDAIAFMVIAQLSRRGINVPGDIAVTGFDGVRFSSIFNPKLTTVDLDMERLAQTAIYLLLKIIRKQPYASERWNCQLKIGESA